MRPTPYQAYVRIMIGCDKFCTYCIVPSVRGPEQSRPPAAILAEARQLADEGCREITLLGQTVNSYQFREGERTWRLSSLLSALHEIAGIERIKFVTNYPKDMTNDLLAAVRDLPKVSKYLHVPVQSGSNAILARMKRGYTVEEYRETLARTRDWIPGVAVTSDFIVGFCGETDDDFQQTIDLVAESRFKNSFIFKYSERPGTKGADLYGDDVPEDVKRRRNNELLALQNEISEADNQAFIGQEVTVLVEGPSKAAEKGAGSSPRRVFDKEQGAGMERHLEGSGTQLTGRTHCDRIVVFDGNPRQIGKLMPVVIYEANAHTLFGEVVTRHTGPEVFELSLSRMV
jgi:tRNA-2-methylthio-N6-dimethylallyladenosine synthase